MKRMRRVGLCVVLACAFGVIAGVSSASAAEYGKCVSQKKGKYSNDACTQLATKKGSFEWHGFNDECYAMRKGTYTESKCETVAEKKGKPDHKGSYEKSTCVPNCGYTMQVSGGDFFETYGDTFPCIGSGVGTITGPKTGEEKMTFSYCGRSSGPWETAELETILIGHGEKGPGGEEPVEGEVWTEYVSKEGSSGLWGIFPFLSVELKLTGSLSGVVGRVNYATSGYAVTFEGDRVGEHLVGTFLRDGELVSEPVRMQGENDLDYERNLEVRACKEVESCT